MIPKSRNRVHKKRLTKRQKKAFNHFKLFVNKKNIPAWELELEEYRLKSSMS